MKSVNNPLGIISVCCLCIIILQPLWDCNAGTISASVLLIVGWVCACIQYKNNNTQQNE